MMEYGLPNDIKDLITNDVLLLFAENLKRNWCDEISDINNLTAWNFYYHVESTVGWSKCFDEALLQNGDDYTIDRIMGYQKNLDWYEWDIFCNEITQLMIDRGIIIEGREEENYYLD